MDQSEATLPERKYMDDPHIVWRNGKPNYDKVNKLYMEGRTKFHPPGSLEKIVENVVKSWEMESQHKADINQWQTMDIEKFKVSVNHGPKYSASELNAEGNYNRLLESCPFYQQLSRETSHTLFEHVFGDGFALEVLEVLAGPPAIVFTWRHFGRWTGQYDESSPKPTGEMIELFGLVIAKVSADLVIEELEVYYDPCNMVATLNGNKLCPHVV